MLSTRKGRVGAVLAASAVVGGVAFTAMPANAATSTLFTVTAANPGKIAAMTRNQVITLTGTGFSEESLAKVHIANCTDGADPAVIVDLPYIVISPTTMYVKTNDKCAVSAGNAITLTDAAGDTLTTATATTKVEFVAPATLATTNPVILNSTAGQPVADQVKTASTSGGATIKVTAGATKFVATGFSASLGGVPLTNVVMGANGDFFTAKVGARAAGDVALSVVSGGVTKNFTVAETGFKYAGSTITVSPAFGPSDGGNVITVAGAGFVPTGIGASTVAFLCGGAPVPATLAAGSTVTSLKVTVPKWVDTDADAATAVEGLCTVKVSTGSTDSVLSAGSTYTYAAQI